MPYVLDFNRETVWAKMERLAGWLGIEGGYPGFLDFVLRLRRDLGIPHTLDRIGVDRARFDEMAAMAVVDPTAGGNPRRLNEADARELYDRAIEGADLMLGPEGSGTSRFQTAPIPVDRRAGGPPRHRRRRQDETDVPPAAPRPCANSTCAMRGSD